MLAKSLFFQNRGFACTKKHSFFQVSHFACAKIVWIFANKVYFAGAYCLSLLMECVFAAMKGVCDTPLHLFGCEGMR